MIEGMHFASPHHLPSFAQVQWSRLSCRCSQGLKDRGEQQRSDWLVDWCCIYTCYTSCDGIQSEMPRSPTCVSTQVPLVGHSSDSLSHLRSHQPLVESHHGIINSMETAFVETLPGNMLVTLGGGDHTLMQCLWWSSEDAPFLFLLPSFAFFAFLSWISDDFHSSFVMRSVTTQVAFGTCCHSLVAWRWHSATQEGLAPWINQSKFRSFEEFFGLWMLKSASLDYM